MTTTEGILITIDGRPALRFERRYRHPLQRVWQAVTEPAEMAQWFPSAVDGGRAVGAELVFDDESQRADAQAAGEPTRADGPVLRGRVVAFDPPNVFSFTWGGELLRYELTPDGDGTHLVFTQILSHESVAARNGAGWDACLGELDRLLGEETEPDPDWKALYDGYVDRMGPPLGVPDGGGSLTWERSTHVDPDRVRAATSDPAELGEWAGAEVDVEGLRWEVEGTDHGSVYRLTVEGAAGDAERASAWHARLLQLDMWMAAGQLVPADPEHWVEDYEARRP